MIACRACASSRLEPVLSLGRTPLANGLLSEAQLGQPEPTYPLDVAFCPACTLVQLTDTVPPEELFREYVYFSSFADTVLANAQEISTRMRSLRRLGRDSLVVEIASNDGYLLQFYRQAGVPVLGIEPATNVARAAQEQKGIPTRNEFFGEALGRDLAARGERADLLHANNVLAHVADLPGVVRGIGHALKPEGVAVIEVPYVRDLIDNVEFDTIYHEHLCYFSLTALVRLFSGLGLVVRDVERIPIHGGSLRVFAAATGPSEEAVGRLLAEEAAWGVAEVGLYKRFRARVEDLRRRLLALLGDLKAQGRSIAAYGASAKGATLLNYCAIDGRILDFVADKSTVKQGRYTPGTHLPIHPPEKLVEARPDFALLLAWNFAEEILAQQEAYRRLGGRFIVPVPEPRIS